MNSKRNTIFTFILDIKQILLSMPFFLCSILWGSIPTANNLSAFIQSYHYFYDQDTAYFPSNPIDHSYKLHWN